MLDLLELLAFFIVFLLVASVWYYWTKPKNLPPGPIGVPFLGCIPYMKKNETIAILQQWQDRYGPIFSFYMGEKPIVVLGSLDVIKEALIKQSEIFSERPTLGIRAIGLGGAGKKRTPNLGEHKWYISGMFVMEISFVYVVGLIMSNGDLWKEQRRFALSTLRDFGFGRPILQGKIHDELSYFLEEFHLQNGKAFDPTLIINNAVSNVTCNLAFGRRFDYSDVEFHEMLKKINFRLGGSNFNFLSPLMYISWAFRLPFIKQKVAKFRLEGDAILDFVENLIVEHEKDYNELEEPNDYIHAFIKAQRNNGGKYFFGTSSTSSM